MKADGTTVTTITNFIGYVTFFLFYEVRYELDGIEIDWCKSVGHTSTLKSYIYLTPNQFNSAENVGWLDMFIVHSVMTMLQ